MRAIFATLLGLAACGGSTVEAPPDATIEFSVQDFCADGIGAEFRFFDLADGLAWPVATVGDLAKVTTTLACVPGAQICYGAQAGDKVWGLGLDGTRPATAGACATCQNNVALGGLSCP